MGNPAKRGAYPNKYFPPWGIVKNYSLLLEKEESRKGTRKGELARRGRLLESKGVRHGLAWVALSESVLREMISR